MGRLVETVLIGSPGRRNVLPCCGSTVSIEMVSGMPGGSHLCSRNRRGVRVISQHAPTTLHSLRGELSAAEGAMSPNVAISAVGSDGGAQLSPATRHRCHRGRFARGAGSRPKRHEAGAKVIVLPAIPFGNDSQQLDQVATISISTATAWRHPQRCRPVAGGAGDRPPGDAQCPRRK